MTNFSSKAEKSQNDCSYTKKIQIIRNKFAQRLPEIHSELGNVDFWEEQMHGVSGITTPN